jgi:hypothetical protein
MTQQCQYGDDLVCAVCGHATDIRGLRRECDLVPLPRRDEQTAEAAIEVSSSSISFAQRIRNFAAAAAQHVAAGMPMCDDAAIIRRHDICLTCEHLQNDACQLCGCPVSRVRGYVSKLAWADQECPAGKWGRVLPSA